MGIDGFFHVLDALPQLLLLDLLLSGDNAVVIALACRSLPPAQMRRAMMVGTAGAIVLRILMATAVGLLLRVPLLKLTGGVVLVVIAFRLLLGDDEDVADGRVGRDASPSSDDLWSAVGTVIVADVVMSLDNVVGLAAVAQGDLLLLSLGLLISMPLLMFGSLFVTSLLQRYPLLVRAGGAMLGWIGGDIAISDPVFADWVNQQSPALTVVVPLLLAIFVLWESRIIARTRPGLAILRRRLARPKSSQPARLAPFNVGLQSEASTSQASATVAIEAAPAVSDGTAVPSEPQRTSARAVDPASMSEGRPRSSSSDRNKRLPKLLGSRWVPAIATVVLAGIGVDLVTRISMPQPAQLHRYDCTGTTATVYFRHGATNLRVATGAAYASGSIRQNNQIEWGDYHATATALGIAPPTDIRRDDEQSVVIDGGGFDRVECTRHVGE